MNMTQQGIEIGLNRCQMIAALESYWYAMAQLNPEEPMDVPAAIQYYWQLPMLELEAEYQYLIMPVDPADEPVF